MNTTDTTEAAATPFKICNVCNTKWQTRDTFLSDPGIELIGYQVHFEALKAGLLYFNHVCKGSLAFYAKDFMDLYDGPVFAQRATGGDACPGHCLHKENLGPCPAECECASVREVLRIVKGWQKVSPV